MQLLKLDKQAIRNFHWFLLIGKKFFKVVPIRTIFSALMTLTSKLTSIIASYLPLKVLILLGGTTIPKFFPSSFKQFDHSELVIGLCGATVGFYLIHLVTEKILNKINNGGGRIILENAKKMQLFEQQSMIAQKGFERYSKILAEIFFLVVTVSVLMWLYPETVLIMTVYILFAVWISVFFFDSSASTPDDEDDNLKTLVSVISHVGILIIFVFMIYQALNEKGPGVLIMFLTFLFIRRSQASINQLIVNTKGLLRQQLEINALFFEEHILIRNKQSHEDLFWSLAEAPKVKQWVTPIIQEFTKEPAIIVECCWFQLDVNNVLAYRVLASDESGVETAYLIKLFGKKQSLAAQHEIEIMLQVEGLPSKKLLVVDEVQGFHCLLYAWEDGHTPSNDEVTESRNVFNKTLVQTKLPTLFLEKYLRSHPVLPQRLTPSFWQHVECVIGPVVESTSSNVALLVSIKNDINKRLNSLPLVIINSKLPRRALLTTKKGALALDWGQWAIEPVGAGWLAKEGGFTSLCETAQQHDFSNIRSDSLKASDINLAANMQMFESLVNSQKFYQACNLIPSILECVRQGNDVGEKV